MSESVFRVEVFHGAAGLDALAESWRGLFDALERPSYVQLWEWHRSFVESLAPDPDAVHVGALYDGDALVAIVPLVFTREQVVGVPVHVAGLPRHEHVRHSDILVHPRIMGRFDIARVLADLRARVRRPWDVTRLGPAMDDATAAAAVRALGPRALAVSEPDGVSDALETGPYEAVTDRLSKNFRGALRKARNKLARREGVTVIWARAPEDVAQAFPRFLEVEASGWKGTGGEATAIGLDPVLRGFYGGLARRLAASGRGRINLMMDGDRVMAGQFGVTAGERYFLLKIGYDETYRQEAPGNLLLERLLQEIAGDAAIRYVDLVSDAAWHQSWRPVQRQVQVHRIFQRTPMGVAAFAALRGKQLLRPMVRDLKRRAHELAQRLRPDNPSATDRASATDSPSAADSASATAE